MIPRIVRVGRLLPLLSLLTFLGTIPVWVAGGAWIVPMLVAVYLVVLQLALEKTGW